MSAPRAQPVPPRLQWTPRALLLYAVGSLLALLALLLRNPVPLFLAVPLLLGPVAAGLYLPNRPVRVAIRWDESGTGRGVTVQGEMETNPPLSPKSLFPKFETPRPLYETDPATVRFEGNKQRFRLRWASPFPFVAEVSLPEVTWRDPLGLAEASLPVDGAPLLIERFPPESSRVPTVRMERTTPLPGEVRSRAVGRAGEFFALRPFVTGDTARQVNWRATARAGRLLANDYLLERTGDLLLLLDLRPTALGEERDEMLLSVSRAAAIGLSRAFLDQKMRVGLATFGEFLSAVPLGSGRRQRHRIRTALRAARIGPESGPPERLAISLRQYFPPGIFTLLLSPLIDEEALALLPHLRRRGYPVIALSPSPVALLAPSPGEETPSDAAALRLLRLVRRRQIAHAWAEAPSVDWEDFWSLAPLISLLRRPIYSRRGR